MNFVVIQHRKPDAPYQTVAQCAEPGDAILFAASLINATPMRGDVQVYRKHQKSLAYCVLALVEPGTFTDAQVKRALENHGAQEKKWKAARAARTAFLARFAYEDWQQLSKDRAFAQAIFGETIREQEAEARAAELGILPTLPTGKAVAA